VNLEPTLGQYLDEWLELQQTRLQPSTWASYRANLIRYLLPAFEDVPLAALRPRALTRHYRMLLAEGGSSGGPLSPRTVRYVHSILHKALADAVREGSVGANASEAAALPRVDPRAAGDGPEQLQVWTAAQLATFLAHTRGHRLAPLWQLAARTGMRRGELLGLTWPDVDLDGGTVAVCRALSMVRRRPQLEVTRTGRPRTLTIDGDARSALHDRASTQQRERLEIGPCWGNDWSLVFTSATGSHLTPDVITREFRRAVTAAPVPAIRLHDLRHTHATLLLQAGVPVKVVSERLGHATVTLTLDTYAHALPSMDADATDRFAALLEAASGEP
jgi:integrase